MRGTKMPPEQKVYDYKQDAVRDSIVGAFRKRKGEATIADIVAFTALPRYQVETELPAVADEYGGRLKVTDSGDILYSFPRGFVSRYRGFGPAFKRFLKAAGKVVRSVSAFLFKVWIMVMLVGYFALFVALAVLALLASVAASSAGGERSSRSRGREGGLGGVMFATRLIDIIIRIWFYNEVFKSPGQRRYETDLRARKRENRRPLSRAIFSFVFGEPDPNAKHDEVQKKAFLALVRVKKGVILLEDFMSITGLSPADAETAINRYLYEFEGIPEVSGNGTVYYRFPGLMKRARSDEAGLADSPMAKVRPFSANAPKANRSYALINGVNLLFGSYFLYCSLALGYNMPDVVGGGTYLYWFVLSLLAQVGLNPLLVSSLVLGVVPLVFSLLFWLVPAIRAGRLKAENERIKTENLRRVLYAQAAANPSTLRAPDPSALPESARPANAKAGVKVLEELAAYEGGEPLAGGEAWRMAELERKLADVATVRDSVNLDDYRLGGTVFDTES
ncbi:MAG: hypothetical protein RBT68_00460 [Spirochaetia bacterium]|nr:hypothetical protein [Spirochaetia bacterium]